MISATLDSYHPAPQGPGFLVPGPRNQASERQHTTPRTRPIVIVLKCTGAIVTTLGQGRDVLGQRRRGVLLLSPETEMYHQQNLATHLSARTEVLEYIEAWYNRHRPHSYNGGLSPVAALAAHHARRQPAAA